VPDTYDIAKMILLIVFFIMVTVATYVQQQYRGWQVDHRDNSKYPRWQ